MMPSFQFDKYTLRPVEGEADLALAAAWMGLDEWHHGQFAPEFWLEQNAEVNSFLLQDSWGAIFFFQTRKLAEGGVEIFIQFEPESAGKSTRTMRALDEGFAWLQKKLSFLGYDALYFTSKNPQLIEFCERRLGFVIEGTSEQGTRLKAYLEHGGKDGEADQQRTQATAG